MKCNLEFFAQEKMGFVSIDANGANQLIGVIAFIYFKTKKNAYQTKVFILAISSNDELIQFLRLYTNTIIPSSNK